MSERVGADDFYDIPSPWTEEEVSSPNGRGAGRYVIRTVKEVLALPEPPSSYELLGPLVYRGSRTIIVGDTGHGKTSLAMQMVHAILAGEETLGHVGAGVGPALIIDLEQGIRSIKRAIRESRLGEREDVHFMIVPDGLALDKSPADYAAVEEALSMVRPVVVLLDPYYKAHQADDPNAERPIIDLFRKLDALRTAYEFALLLPAHPRKADKTQQGIRKLTIHDVAGSGAATRGAEIILGLERRGQGSARLRYLKDRDGDSPVGEHVALLYSKEGGFRLDEQSPQTEEGLEESLLAVMDEGRWQTVTEWAREVKVTDWRVKAMLEKLAADPLKQVYFMLGPPGRHPTAQCYSRSSEVPDDLRRPAELWGEERGHPGRPPIGGDDQMTTSSEVRSSGAELRRPPDWTPFDD